jgi:hypothetical protein
MRGSVIIIPQYLSHQLLLSSFSTTKPFAIIAIFVVAVIKAFTVIIIFTEVISSISFVVLW